MLDGDTLLVDANNGTPCYTAGCNETANYATITGANGRPVIDPGANTVYNGLWMIYGHDVVIDNFEFRNTALANSGSNRSGIWIK
jgi:hypothetical protein